jgi:hypothetical protein
MDDVYETLDFVSARGIPFRAVLSLKNSSTGELTVAFYDQRYDFTVNGQFTGASYYVSTLLGSGYERLCEAGLSLHGGVPDWTLDTRSFRTVANWAMEVVG